MRRIIIVGMAGPYEKELEPGEELWGVNKIYKRQSNLSRLYFMDDLKDFDDEFCRDVQFLDIPVYSHKKYDDIKGSVEYPLEDIKAMFEFIYFTSSIAYMIAHAIYEMPDAIHLHKILPFPLHGDYEDQKPCLEMWSGLAIGKGIKLTRSEDSSIMKPLYWQTDLYGLTDLSHAPGIKLLFKAGFRLDIKSVAIKIPDKQGA